MSDETPAAGPEFRVVNGDSDMAHRIQAFDWSTTALGSPEAWPISLRTTLGLMLDSSHGMCLVWGPDRTFFYNDAYAPFLVDRHPWALGRPIADVWADVWSDIAPLVDQAMRGERVHFEDMHLTMTREGEPQDTWWTFSYSPVRDDAGRVAGMLNVTTDTSGKVRALGSAQAERERLQRAMQQMPGFVALLSGAEHRFTYANDAYMEIAGHRDVLGRTVREVFPELSGQGFYDLLDQVYATGERYEARALPIRLSQDSGASRYIDLLYEAVRDDSGAVTGIFVGGYDTTDRVRADGRLLALAELSERMRTATAAEDLSHAAATVLAESLGVSRVGYAAVDGSAENLTIAGEWSAPGMAVAPGEVALQAYGDVADALSRHEMVVVTDSSLDSRTSQAADVLAREHARAFVNVPIVEDGKLSAVLYLANDTPRDWREDELSLARDVAERTRSALERQTAQDGRRESEARYRALFEAVDVGFCVVEMKFDAADRAIDYRLVEINPAFERQTGLYGAQGKWVSEAAPGLERHWFDTYGAVALTGEAVRFENEAAPFERWYDVHAFRTGEPDERRVAILFNDITERRLAEQRLKALNDTLEQQVETRTAALMTAEDALRQSQKMEAVGQLTGGIAHDFNNLLAGITGSLDLIGKRIAEGRFGDVERFSSAAQHAAKRAAALTHRLLAFSRRQTLDPKPTDANRLVRDMEDLVRRTVGPAVEVEVVAAAGLWTTLVDPNQLENALLNLCINGRDAMPDGGRLTIETANRWIDESAARALDLAPGPYVSLSVSDSGQGMSPEVIQRAFEPFFTTKPLGEGTGLGLSMIYGFVRQSGGQVRIYSEPGEGALICLYLPRHSGEVEDAAAPAPTPAPPRANAGETVLVVDDEPTVRMLVSEILHDLGYHSIEAGDGLSGLGVLQSNTRVDLLVTDVGLPGGMNGRQLADAARISRPDLKVLFITGYAENAVVGNGQLDSGMHVMTKPFELAALSRRIADLIAG